MATPTETPVTSPVLLMVAMVGLLVLHVPPGVELANCVVPPRQVEPLPVDAETFGEESTLTLADILFTQPTPGAVTV